MSTTTYVFVEKIREIRKVFTRYPPLSRHKDRYLNTKGKYNTLLIHTVFTVNIWGKGGMNK